MKSSDSVKTYLNEIRSVPLLTEELRKLKQSQMLTGQEILKQVQNDIVNDGEAVSSDDETEMDDAGKDLLNIAEEISELCESKKNKDLLVLRILDADRLTGIIEKTVEKMRGEREAGKNEFSGILSSIDEIEHRLQEAKDRFIRANLRLSADIARKYSRNDTQLMDLIQEGNIGLMRAVEKFDYRKGYRF